MQKSTGTFAGANLKRIYERTKFLGIFFAFPHTFWTFMRLFEPFSNRFNAIHRTNSGWQVSKRLYKKGGEKRH